jgi:hypothetical protein
MPAKGDCGLVPGKIWGRRDFMRIGSLAAFGLTTRDLLAATNGAAEKDERSVILLWLSGGPAQMDTFDMKPDADKDVRGAFKPIKTNVPGMTICEHLPRVAKVTDKHAVIRSMVSPFVEHRDGIAMALTGYRPLPSLEFPCVAAVVSKEKGPREGMPPYVAIPQMYTSQGPGFLGGEYGPFLSGDPNATGYRVRDLNLPIDTDWSRVNHRQFLLKQLDSQFREMDAEAEFQTLDKFYEKAYSLMRTPKIEKAFSIHEEKEELRNAYGRTPFGQGCLLARRLVESGTRFVTVSKGWLTWDTHFDNFNRMETLLLPEFDMAYSALLSDLDSRGLLKNTLVIAMGEFGRTPKVNSQAGRDHWGSAFSMLMSGCGVVGGQNIGATDETAGAIKDYPCSIEDLITTIYDRLGIDYNKEYMSPIGRPVRIANGGQVIKKLFV